MQDDDPRDEGKEEEASEIAFKDLYNALEELLRWHVTQPGYIAKMPIYQAHSALEKAKPFIRE